MKTLLMQATSGDLTPAELKQSVRNPDDSDMTYRRAIIGVSLLGMASMAVVTLLQMGILRHLPDPQTSTPNFDTDKVNTSEEAFSYGMPDAPLTIAAHAASLAIAAAGPATGTSGGHGFQCWPPAWLSHRQQSRLSICSTRCRRSTRPGALGAFSMRSFTSRLSRSPSPRR